MTGQSPVLDSRKAADIAARLAELASTSVPAWRPPPGGDAGTMLHQGFARLVELVLGQLNQVPEKNLLAFLDTMGVSLLAPAPARLPLTITLAAGNPPTLVSAGATAAAGAGDGQPAVTFQTEADLTVLPASLVAARTVDPVSDRGGDLTAAIAGTPAGFSPFTGTLLIQHALWFGTGLLPGAGQSADVTLTLGYSSRRAANEVTAFFGAMTFGYASGGTPVTAVPSRAGQPAAGTVALTLTTGPVDQQTLAAPGLAGPVTGRWLRTALTRPLPLDPVAQDLTVTSAAISVSRGGLLPDTLIAGQATADPSKDFQPFGPAPQVGDAFCIGSDEVFGKTGARVQVSFAAGSGTAQNAGLAWEYLGPAGWSPLPASIPAGFGLTSNATVTIGQLPLIAPASVEGQVSRWIRVRIASGGYGTPVQWTVSGTSLVPRAGTGNLDPPRLRSVTLSYTAQATPAVLRQTDATFSDQSTAVAAASPFSAYQPVTAVTPAYLADPDPAFYLGLDSVAPGYPMTCYIAPAVRAAGRLVMQPQPSTPASTDPGHVTWEYFNGQGWRPLPVLDQTAGLAVPGTIVILTPADMAPLARFGPDARYWIRARAPRTAPADQRLLAGVYLNTVSAVQSATAVDEPLGSGNAQPGQVFQLAQPPVLAGQQIWVPESELPSAAEQQAIQAAEGPDAVTTRPDPLTGQPQVWIRWHEVANFVCSGPADRHYTIDHSTGTITFGDGSRGLILPASTASLSASYQTGGGLSGNVPAGAVTQLLSPLPAVQAVTNPLPADGGAPGETIALVRDRGPQAVRNRDRVVAARDFEWLARQAAGTRVARAICLPNVNDSMRFEPGWVTLITIPSSDQPRPSPGVELIRQVEEYLLARASTCLVLPVPVRINVVGPGYVKVTVTAKIVPLDITQAAVVKQRIATALRRYLHPLTGGLAGTGWVSGRAVYVSEVASVIEGTPGVSYVTSLRLRPAAIQRRLTLPGAPVAVAAPAGSLVVSRDRRKSFALAEPVQAATLAATLTATGLREGDTITSLLDLTLDRAAPGSATFTAVPAPWPAPAGFLAGTTVIGPGGRRTRLAQPLGPWAAGAGPAAVPVAVTDPGFADGLPPGSAITLAGGPSFTITAIAVRAAQGGTLADITTLPVTGDVTYPAGAVLGTPDGRVRLPLAAPAAPDPVTAAIGSCTLAELQPGEQIQVLTGDGGTVALTATLAALAPVDDLVYLDPGVFPYATEHQLDMIGP